MATSPDILIANEITTAINGAVLSVAFTAERLYSAEWSVTD